MGNLINIKNYPVPHNRGNGGGGGVTYVTYNNSSNSVEPNGNVNVSYVMSSDGRITRLEGDELKYRYGQIGELESEIINTGQLFADSIESGKIKTDDLDAIKAYIKRLDSQEITTEYLTVTKQAHFFELIIDKVRAVGGQIILTPAQAAIDKVYAYKQNGTLVSDPLNNLSQVSYFDVYWKATDYTGRGISNDWVVGDQAYCQSFNVTEPGVYHDIANKYYWRLVKAILDDKMINFTTNAIANVGDTISDTNNIYVGLRKTTYQGTQNAITWTAGPQIDYAGVIWDNTGSSTNYAVRGTMHTSSTTLGIQILPTGDNAIRLTDSLTFRIYNTNGNVKQSNINIGIYFQDGTSQYYPDVQVDDSFYVTLDLGTPETQIEAIVINCSQPVQWNKCHGIRLSNVTGEIDRNVYDKASIPEAGDNIVQLGYRPDDDANRRSAIIIAAYKTPDTDLTAPSYAQYTGINDFNLKSHRQSYFDANGAKFIGSHEGNIELCTVDGEGNTIADMVIDQQGIHTEVNGLSGQVSTFEQTVTGFNAKVQQYSSDVNGYRQQVSSFQQTVTGFNTTVTNYTTAVNGYKNQVSSFQQTVNGFNSTVQQYSRDVNGYSQQVSSFQQTVDGFSTRVSRYESAVNTYSNQYSQVIQNYNSIKSEVYDEINGKLVATGINITNGQITLKANKTSFESSSGDVTWLKGNINGTTKWDLAINSYSPIMRFGNCNSLTATTYITTDQFHINTDGRNTNFITLQVVNNEPSIFLKRGDTSCDIYIDSSNRLRIEPGSQSYWVREANRTTTSSGGVYADNDGFLKINNWS